MTKHQDIGIIEQTVLITNEGESDIYWVTVSMPLVRKVIARYGPFETETKAIRYAKEHHITLQEVTV